MKKVLLTMLLVTAMVMASVGIAAAESILFPYVVYNTAAGLDTMVTVINMAASNASFLHYQYQLKNATATNANLTGCTADSHTRPTTANDIVTFAVGGSAALGSGNAMFNDATNYNVGVGAPSFRSIFASPAVGYLVVYPSTAGGTAILPGSELSDTLLALDGEASIYDITSGAMWGYRAVPSTANTPNVADFTAALSLLRPADAPAATAATTPAPRVSFYPHSSFTSRFFVTPATTAMHTTPAGANTNIGLFYGDAARGVYNRNEAVRDGGTQQSLACVGRVDASVLSPALTNASALLNEGGWAYFNLVSTDTGAFVYELKYGSISGGAIINDAKPVVRNAIR